ncbi:hypothetical protein NA56DRAFT_259041 [Hyaloscypha hepaticicola]|uniref:Uncharacterized protein n=1 Tax=Hyaloscypha hepaticicola TaxID=2082293 RepID=A0A2J6PVT9_9HELO|nr:hypothetical protein NA56DRAFT_259041 [Hyaloscypha hepaticicola]
MSNKSKLSLIKKLHRAHTVPLPVLGRPVTQRTVLNPLPPPPSPPLLPTLHLYSSKMSTVLGFLSWF